MVIIYYIHSSIIKIKIKNRIKKKKKKKEEGDGGVLVLGLMNEGVVVVKWIQWVLQRQDADISSDLYCWWVCKYREKEKEKESGSGSEWES